MRRLRRFALACLTGAAAAALAAPAGAAPRVTLDGGTAASAKLCGATQVTRLVAPGQRLSLVVAPARMTRVRRARVGSSVLIDRCVNGRWTTATKKPLGGRRTVLRRVLASDTEATGDYRVRTRMRRGNTGRPVFVRIGVGELVDVPVSFRVANQNRTAIPCMGAPDGRTHPVRGTLVAPRTVLDAPKPAVTLYLHGLGYSSFFFRFKDVPGYDYGLQQARAGHASVVVDRLGNPAQEDLPDGNATCLPAQADMADQLVTQLRSGASTPRFSRVALAGHSLGGFIAEVAQYSFSSADALALISYTDTPSPYALQTFSAAGMECATAPKRARGTSGAPNYASFGATDEDFRMGHFFNIEDDVAAAVLRRRNRDACGDLMSATQSLVANQVAAKTISAPVLVVSGAQDALFTPPGNQLQAAGFAASSDVTLVEIPDTGHAITLGRTHLGFRSEMDRWLTRRGF